VEHTYQIDVLQMLEDPIITFLVSRMKPHRRVRSRLQSSAVLLPFQIHTWRSYHGLFLHVGGESRCYQKSHTGWPQHIRATTVTHRQPPATPLPAVASHSLIVYSDVSNHLGRAANIHTFCVGRRENCRRALMRGREERHMGGGSGE
jgi:hypothetical protein